jgi:hypothetical protein
VSPLIFRLVTQARRSFSDPLALGVDALGAGGVEADRPQPLQRLDQAGQGPVPGRAGRLPRPGQDARARPRLGHQQRIECFSLRSRQGGGELAGDVALGRGHRGRDQLLNNRRP